MSEHIPAGQSEAYIAMRKLRERWEEVHGPCPLTDTEIIESMSKALMECAAEILKTEEEAK